MKQLVSIDRIGAEFNDWIEVSYYIYGGCKFNCEYCFLVGYNRSEQWRQRTGGMKNVDLDTQYKIVDTLFRLPKPFNIYIYGGEPTEYKDLHNVMRYIHSKLPSDNFRTVELQTNLNITIDDLKRYCEYDHIIISPTIHLNYLKGDTIHDLEDKLDLIHSYGKLERVDFMLEPQQESLHREFNSILKTKPYFDKVMHTFNYMEINTNKGGLHYYHDRKDVYTGRFNTLDQYKDLLDTDNYKEQYKLTYDDGSSEVLDISEMYTRHLSFKGWKCDAGKFLMIIEYTGDWWICESKYMKQKPMGNLIKSPAKFLMQTRVHYACDLDKCDGCYFVKKVK
jgi:organic radical activating enzyme